MTLITIESAGERGSVFALVRQGAPAARLDAAYWHPMGSDLLVRPFHRGPGCAMRDFLLAVVAPVRCERVIEGLAIDVLGMRWQVITNRRRKVFI